MENMVSYHQTRDEKIYALTTAPASSQDRVEHVNALNDWDEAEERALVRKLDLRVLFPCCIVYFLAYLDRANMGFVNVMQSGSKDSFEESLHLEGIDFNWVCCSIGATVLVNSLLR